MNAAGESKLADEVAENKTDVTASDDDLFRDEAPTSAQIRALVNDEIEATLRFVGDSAGAKRYESLERGIIRHVFRLGRLLVALFLCLASERLELPTPIKRGRKEFRQQPAKSRLLGTFFGKVRYWRAYMHQTNGRGGGFHPLDLRLGLRAEGFSLGVLSRAAKLATKMSFAVSVRVMAGFLNWAPSATTVEEAVLGLGAYTTHWFEKAEAPEEDGEVLIIQIDSKGTPTATEEELAKRRGKRHRNGRAPSPRHRGRHKRSRRKKKEQRKKGDKSKNARMATLVVMYTLKPAESEDGAPLLLGPLNPWVYASYAPKRHAFAIARREADKRGFTAGSGKLVQILTDGDEDLAAYITEFFPEVRYHTLDIIHAVERIWKAAACVFEEGSDALTAWVEERKTDLYAGRIGDVLIDMESEFRLLPKGKKRDRLEEHLNYLTKRQHLMNYGELIAQDLEISTGACEGAVRYVISERFDEGGMRWIRERAECLLQLRCIEINGDWERFIDFVDDRICAEQERRLRPIRLLRDKPNPLPDFGRRDAD